MHVKIGDVLQVLRQQVEEEKERLIAQDMDESTTQQTRGRILGIRKVISILENRYDPLASAGDFEEPAGAIDYDI